MSYWSNLADSFLDGLMTAGRAVLDVAAPAVAKIVATARKIANGVIDGVNNAFIDPPATERERIDRDLQETNEQLMRLRARHLLNGELSAADQDHHRHLKQRRLQLLSELEVLDGVELAEELVDDAGALEAIDITEAQFHLLQYQVGQGSRNKRCHVCGRNMVLQWDSRIQVVQKREQFFWGCIGFYADGRSRCLSKAQLSDDDFKILLSTKRSEFECSPEELSAVTFDKDPERVRDAIRSIRSKLEKKKQGLNRYRCPVHGERLILKEKKEFDGLQDQFFLGCPRWLADNTGCGYVVKLKSAAQISAALEAGGESGVLHVVGMGGSQTSMRGKRWYPHDDQALAEMVRAGKLVDEICLLMRRNQNGILARIAKLGLALTEAPFTSPAVAKASEGERTMLPCPGCRQLLRVPKGKHGQVECPACKVKFEATT